MNREKKSFFSGEWGFDLAVMAVLIALCIVILYPLYYVLVASFTDPNIVNTGQLLLYPKQLYLDGYKKIFEYRDLWSGYWNTIKYTVIGTALSIICTIPGAYALSRRDLMGRRKIMFLFTFTMFFQGGIIPLFLVINNLRIYDSIWAVTMPTAVSVWNFIVCRTFFESSIPTEILEAARIDGCNEFQIFFRVVMPISATIVAVMILFYATAQWNSFMNPLMFLRSGNKMPLQVVLRNLVLSNQAASMSADALDAAMRQKMAEQMKYGIIVVSAVPLLCVYPFLQKYFVKGVTVGAVKG